jgi:hypothetical protein
MGKLEANREIGRWPVTQSTSDIIGRRPACARLLFA